MAKKTAKKQSKGKIAVEVGAGVLAAAAAAGAGYYFYGSKNAKKHRASANKWVKGMKADVVKEAKKLKKIDQKAVAMVVDKAAAAYSTVRSVDKQDLRRAAAELKKNWKLVGAEIGGAVKSVRKAPKKAAKKSSKKAPKKAAKKSSKKAAKRSR